MSTMTSKRTGTLVSSAVLAAVCGTITAPVMADPPTTIDLFGEQFQDGTNYLWDFITGTHNFGSTEFFDSNAAPGSGYLVEVTSGSSGPGAYFLSFDWTDFDLGFGIGFDYDQMYFMLDINVDALTLIDNVQVTDAVGGNAFTTSFFSAVGGMVDFQVNAQDIVDNNGIIVVEWTQSAIPAPGALALLGLAGFMGSRRRRRDS